MADRQWWHDGDAAEVESILTNWWETASLLAVPCDLQDDPDASVGSFFDDAECLQIWLIANGIDATPICDLATHVQVVSETKSSDAPNYYQCSMIFSRAYMTLLAVGVLAGNDAPLKSQNHERDVWMYEQRKAGKSNGEIRYALNSEHREWEQIDTDQGISGAIARHCMRHRLPRPKQT